MKMVKAAALAASMLALQSCFFAPGKFDSTLELRRDGRFTFAYTGEVLFFEGEPRPSEIEDKCYGGPRVPPPPPPPPPAPVRDNLVQDAPRVVTTIDVGEQGQITAVPRTEIDVPRLVTPGPGAWGERPCTPAEKAQRAAARDRQQREQAAMLAAVVGFDPSNPASVRTYVAELKRYPGWREVTHRGGNRFHVDYRLSGTTDRDFLFPLFENVVVHTPFVTMRPRNDGSAEVRAPAFGGGGMGVFGAMGGLMGPGMRAPGADDPYSRMLKATDGTFTIVTDGEIRTNNTTDGPTMRSTDRVLSWKVTALAKEAPRALVQLR